MFGAKIVIIVLVAAFVFGVDCAKKKRLFASNKLKNRTICSSASSARAQRHFSVSLYLAVSKVRGNSRNMIISPFAVGSGLLLTRNGAVGTTKKQIEKVLLHEGSGFRSFKKHVPCLASIYTNKKFSEISLAGKRKSATIDQPTTLLKATKLYGEKSLNFKKSFIKQTIKSGYKFELIDFKTSENASRKAINAWVSRNTKNHINNFFNKDDITSSTKQALVSTIYFKGLWQSMFKTYNTYEGEFRIPDNRKVKVQYMDNTAFYRTLPIDDVHLLELPYRSEADKGIHASMILITARGDFDLTHSIARIQENRRGELGELIAKLLARKKSYYNVVVPKFKISSEDNIKVPLKKMGVRVLFQRKKVNLSNMADFSLGTESLEMPSYIQKTVMGITEKGTEISGATGYGFGLMVSPPRLKFDKPFMFIIYDKSANSILFIGRVSDPSPE